MSFDVPILLCIYNRPEVTARTFAAIARQQPQHLLIAGDGPRGNPSKDFEQVQLTRRIVQQIDWDCNFQARFSNENLGCRQHMARAIGWGFEQFEHLIILEDDCLAGDSFFPFCRQLLERYADHPDVMTIGGINHLHLPSDHDYRFSKYPFIWGWASWRRAWQRYDLEMKQWQNPETQSDVLDRWTETAAERSYWNDIFAAQSQGKIDTWDYSWTFASWLAQGLSIVPRVNLVSNIGFGCSATHTTDSQSQLAGCPSVSLDLVNHPSQVQQDQDWDRAAAEFYFPPPTVPMSVPQANRSSSILSRLFRAARKLPRAA